jgi:outer membrane protein OmpA-like peptidoglycan-associated protein
MGKMRIFSTGLQRSRDAAHHSQVQASSKAVQRKRAAVVSLLGNQAVQRLVRQGALNKKGVASIQRQDKDGTPPVHGPLFMNVSPFMARAAGSATIDGFTTGKADVSPGNEEKLKTTARMIAGLFYQYPGSTVRVTGHTDAVDTEELNMQLGMERAESTAAVLVKNGVSAESIVKESKGEGELLVKTQNAEPRNRRAEVSFEPLVPTAFLGLPEYRLSTPPPSGNAAEPETPKIKIFPDPYSYAQPNDAFSRGGVSEAGKPQIRNWLEEGLKRDPLIHELPPWMRDKVVDALKDADEMLAEKIIDSLPLGGKEKEAVKAVAKTVLQLIKGKRYTPPVEKPWRYMPPDTGRSYGGQPYRAPGETIINGPSIDLPWWFL